MTYHDKNRLLAHLDQPLPSGTKAVALFVSEAQNHKTGSIEFSASYIAKQLGVKSRKTIEKHLNILADKKIFTFERRGERKPRVWKLAIPCPPTCDHLKSHNSEARLKQLQQAKVVDNSDQMSKFSDQMSNFYSTNKTKDIKIDDIEIQFSNLELSQFVTGVIAQLSELKPDHNSLLEFIDSHKAEVESKALAILKKRKPTYQGKYLASVVTDTPAELFRHLITKTKTKASSKSVATIHNTTATTARVDLPRLRGYASKQLGFEITEATKYYLQGKLKLGLPIGHRDLVICLEVERHNNQLRDEQLNTNSELELTCLNGLPNLSWTGENHNWNFYSQEFLDNHQGKPTISEGYQLAQAHIEELNKHLVRLYELLPLNSNLEAYDLEAWILSNYDLDDDLKEFLEAYPAKPEGISWNAELTKEELGLAQQRGLAFDELKARAKALPSNSTSWTAWHKHPHTWLREQYPNRPALASSDQIDPRTASSLIELTQALSKP